MCFCMKSGTLKYECNTFNCSMCVLYYRAVEMRASSQQVTVAAVRPASHHTPSFGGSTPMKTSGVDTRHHLVQLGGRQPSSAKPAPLPLPTAGPLTSKAAGCLIGSRSSPVVGSTRQTVSTTATTARYAVTLSRRLMMDAKYVHRFRFLFARYTHTVRADCLAAAMECCTGAGAVKSRGIPVGLPRDRNHFL